MAKVVKLFNKEVLKQEELVRHIQEFLDMAKNGDIKNFLVSASCEDGTVLTGYCNLDLGERQYMQSHIQVDINHDIVMANIEVI